MPKRTASDEAIIQAVKQAEPHKAEEDHTLAWAPFDLIRAAFPDEDEKELLRRLQNLAAHGKLAMTFGWANHVPIEVRDKVPPIVGYQKDSPLFRVLGS